MYYEGLVLLSSSFIIVGIYSSIKKQIAQTIDKSFTSSPRSGSDVKLTSNENINTQNDDFDCGYFSD